MKSHVYFADSGDNGILIHHSAGNSVVGRIQALAPGVVRIEAGDEREFVDAPTLTAANRGRHSSACCVVHPDSVVSEALEVRTVADTANGIDDAAGTYACELIRSVELVQDGHVRQLPALDGVEVPSEGVRLPLSFDDHRTRIACETGIWFFRDAPRLVDPWTSLQAAFAEDGEAVWKLDPHAPDWYVFAWNGNAEWLRRRFLDLTGPIPMPPLWMFGMWHSRYYPYRQEEALELIDRYREHGFPLDAFVVDTDWREGGSRGYRINRELFPDMQRFFEDAHRRRVHIMFNDHPEHKGREALDESLLRYRHENLTKLLEMGLDGWWFDRNWREIFYGPHRGIESSVWGQLVYAEIDRSHRDRNRAQMLSMRTDHPAGHRYPIWWTGDIYSDWEALTEAVEETIDAGSQLFPYTGQDIGGHFGFPDVEQYVRWVQWGAVSPTFRLHCGPRNRFREPWRFGERAETIARRYSALRMKLVPLLYALAYEANSSGTPLLRDVSFVDPEFAAGVREPDRTRLTDHFFLGSDLWIAPVHSPAAQLSPDFQLLQAELIREVFTGTDSNSPLLERAEAWEVRLSPTYASRDRGNWGSEFFVRWRGSFTVPESGYYRFVLSGSGIKELCIGVSAGSQVEGEYHPDGIDDSPAAFRSEPPQVRSVFDKGRNELTLELEAENRYPIEVTYLQRDDEVCSCYLSCSGVPEGKDVPDAPVDITLPPGEWIRLHDGSIHRGQKELHTSVSLEELPLFVGAESIVPLAPYAESTEDLDWREIELHIRPPVDPGGSVTRTLFADDGESDSINNGAYVTSSISVMRDDAGTIRVVARRSGTTHDRASEAFAQFDVRLHLEVGESVKQITSTAHGSANVVYETLSYGGESIQTEGTTAFEAPTALRPDAESVRVWLPLDSPDSEGGYSGELRVMLG